MMTTDSERREVARRLREIRPCKSGHIKWWEIARALGLKQPAGWFGWEKFEPDSANRLADLIEPSCDSDKLLEEVKELEKCAWYFGLDFDEDEPLRDRLEEASEAFAGSARRIREALEVES